ASVMREPSAGIRLRPYHRRLEPISGERGLEGLQLSSERRGDSLIVAASGDLDVVTGREFDQCLTVARRDHDRIVLDLSGVDFMDTSALAVIVGHWKALLAAGGT